MLAFYLLLYLLLGKQQAGIAVLCLPVFLLLVDRRQHELYGLLWR